VGNRIGLQTWRGAQSWGYDGLNRGQSLTDIQGGRYTWSYDLHGRLQEVDYANRVIFTVTYSAGGGPAQGRYASAADPQVDHFSATFVPFVSFVDRCFAPHPAGSAGTSEHPPTSA